MIKNHNGRKLGVTASHRRSMLRNLTTSLFLHEKIQTTLPKAKELVRFSSKIITKARPGDLNAHKAVFRDIKDKDVVKKLFEVIVPRYQNRPGGYVKIYRLGTRIGDRASVAIVKLVN